MKPASIIEDLKNIISIHSGGTISISADDTIGDLFTDEFDEMSWVGVIVSLEILHQVEIPDDLAEAPSLSFNEFAEEVIKLPRETNRYFAAEKIKMLQDSFLSMIEDMQNE